MALVARETKALAKPWQYINIAHQLEIARQDGRVHIQAEPSTLSICLNIGYSLMGDY